MTAATDRVVDFRIMRTMSCNTFGDALKRRHVACLRPSHRIANRAPATPSSHSDTSCPSHDCYAWCHTSCTSCGRESAALVGRQLQRLSQRFDGSTIRSAARAAFQGAYGFCAKASLVGQLFLRQARSNTKVPEHPTERFGRCERGHVDRLPASKERRAEPCKRLDSRLHVGADPVRGHADCQHNQTARVGSDNDRLTVEGTRRAEPTCRRGSTFSIAFVLDSTANVRKVHHTLVGPEDRPDILETLAREDDAASRRDLGGGI